MNQEIKVFFVDLDGTLLDERKNGVKTISQVNRKALVDAMASGIEVVISTGRIGKKARYWLQETNLNYAVIGNGAQIIDKNNNILKQLNITSSQLKMIVAFCQKHQLALKIDDVRIAYGVTDSLHQLMAEKLMYAQRSDYHDIPLNKAIKIIVWGKNPQKLVPLAKPFMAAVPGVSVVSAERGRTLEVTHAQATKGLGNNFILKKLNLTKAQSAHIGDTMNDFSAIDYVGKFIAMGDGAPELLARAEYIAANHHQHAVAKVLGGEYQKNPFKIK